MRRRMLTLAMCGAGAFAGLTAGQAEQAMAGFEIVAESVSLDADAERFVFSVTFSEVPDFVALDENGEPVHAFQYEIDSDDDQHGAPFEFDRIDTIVRGSEIHLHDDAGLPVRSIAGAGGPEAGGWGRLLDVVPFDLQDRAVTFFLSQDLIDDTDGQIQYRLAALARGEMTSSVVNRTFIPLPAAAWSGLFMLGGVALVGSVGRLRRLGE